MKLAIILCIWYFNINRTWAILLIFYFIITTVITYLKYHFWDKNSNNDYERNRRRFINMMLSFAFIIIAYGYLYDVPFEYAITKDNISSVQSNASINNLTEKNDNIGWDDALLYSTSNAFGGNYSSVVAVNNVGDWLSISQFIITFVYITLVFAKSLFNEGEKENGIQK